jgi:flavin reductase (DIM6/NTAB) family NADH-FMN oxidoreductase RutF
MAPELTLVHGRERATPVREFTNAMSALASGVVIVTCRIDGRPWGMTVTSFASVSADPPTVLVSLGSDALGAAAIAATHRFGVSILTEAQVTVACHGSITGAAKYLEAFTDSSSGRSRSPVLAGALAHLDCELQSAVRVEDHTVFFGRVREARAAGEGMPLLYHRRAYHTLAEPASLRPTGERSNRCYTN